MFRTKICGVTLVEDALAAVAESADAIGLNFYSKSSRCVTLERSTEIAEAVGGKVQLVGVFVNSFKLSIERIVDGASLTAVQLHGDEPPSFLVSLKAPRIIKAFRADPEWLPKACAYLSECRKLGRLPEAVLIDAPAAEGQYGGTGKTVDWQAIPGASRELRAAAELELPILLAGGLNGDNVRQAILESAVDGVDTASGVETKPGVKSRNLIHTFVKNATEAFRDRTSR
jgi:phosphoribosylanthranilate isomerase